MYPVIRCTLSGSFHRDIDGLRRVYYELARNGCQILSPHRLDFVDLSATFVRDKLEKTEGSSDLEKHHLKSIAQSNFLWIHAPDGYIGISTAMEIGYAIANKIPVFTSSNIQDEMLAELVTSVVSVFAAVEMLEI